MGDYGRAETSCLSPFFPAEKTSATACLQPNDAKKKICMVGQFGVGKTSLVRRFVDSIFDERYLTTLGVKIDRKDVSIAASP